MTSNAGRVSRAKRCAHMACLAGNIYMGAIEYEPGAEVVKCFLGHCG